MSKSKKPQAKIFLDYIPAQLSKGKNNWEIYYYVKHPDTGCFRRIRIRINRIKSLTERRKYSKILIQEINLKLYKGWNPFVEREAPKAFYFMKDVITTYMNIKIREGNKNTIRSYKSYTDIFVEYLDDIDKGNIYVSSFTKTDARDFINYVFIKRTLSNRTFNNYLRFFRTLWNWFIEYSYLSQNVFADIKMKKTNPKIRLQFIEPSDRNKIIKYLSNKPDYYILAVKLAYHCLIRPGELTYLKIKDININEQIIFLSAANTKNSKDRYATIPDVLIKELVEMYNKYTDKSLYVFSEGFVPGKRHIDSRNISKRWERMRTHLGLIKEMQFYSLRDTGIIQKLRDGVSPDEVMYQADHHSLEVTNKYVKMATPRIIKGVKEKASKF